MINDFCFFLDVYGCVSTQPLYLFRHIEAGLQMGER